MKKLFTFWLMVAFVAISSLGVTNAQDERPGYYKNPLVNENFDGLEALPDTWSGITGNSALFGRAGTLTVGDGRINITGAGTNSGNRGYEFSFPRTSSNEEMAAEATTWIVETDWTINSSTNIGNKNAMGLIFYGPNSTNITAGEAAPEPPYLDLIFGIYLAGPSGFFHYWNMDLLGTVPDTSEGAEEGATVDIGPAFVSGQYPGFYRAGADLQECLTNNLATQTNVAFTAGKTYRVIAELDFVNKKVVSLTITDKEEPENTQTITDMPFISDQVTELSNFSVVNTRATGRGLGNGGNAPIDSSIDDFTVYYWKQSEGKGDVLVTFKDQNDNEIKTVRHENQEAGLFYQSPLEDKQSFKDESTNMYYAYDALLSTPDVMVVKDTENEVTLVFKGSPAVMDENFVWSGVTDNNWDQLTENFTLNGAAASYQYENGVEFSDENSTNKNVVLNEIMNMGMGDVRITAPGYSLSGTGRVEGIGTMDIEKDATINIPNRLEGGIIFTGDTLTLQHAEAVLATSAVQMKESSVLRLETSFSAPIKGYNGPLTMIQNSNSTASSTITDVSELNYVLVKKGGFSGYTYNTAVTRMNNVYEGTINVSTVVGDSSLFSVTGNSPATKFNLGDDVYMVYGQNPGKAAAGTIPATGTTMEIGAISGTAGSFITGSRLNITGRYLTYDVGGLNTDETFAGKIMVWNDQETFRLIEQNFNKVGTGKWTLTGESPDYFGIFNVTGGTLELGGRLGDVAKQNQVAMEVGTEGILKGIGGTLATSTLNIIGTYRGSLTVETDGNDVSFTAGTAKMYVNSFDDGDYDKLTVVNGGLSLSEAKLEVSVYNLPAPGTTITLFEVDEDAGAMISDFDIDNPLKVSVNGVDITDVGSGVTEGFYYSYNDAQSKLLLTFMGGTWPDADPDPGSSIENEYADKDKVSTTYYDLTGKVVSADAKGIMIERIIYTDGTVTAKKVIIK